jgi:phosphate transport system ATP-binding protein
MTTDSVTTPAIEDDVNLSTGEVFPERPTGHPVMQLTDVAVAFAGRTAVRDVTFDVHDREITALIGPSGSGKTTLLRALNRMHDTVRTAKVTGTIMLGDTDVYAASTDPTLLRSRVGMVFQRPNPFPTMSIYENAVAGLRFNGVRKKPLLDEAAESSLVAAALWDSVKDRLKAHASTLSGGEQQRLCIARALAVEPEVLLMDEPTSALDPIATKRIEELIGELKNRVTIIIVTHNMQQAMRVSDRCAFLLMGEDKAGELIEFDATAKLFSEPDDARTLDYVNGRFG